MFWWRYMQAHLLALATILALSCSAALAVDLTGTWESKYDFGPGDEVMTAKIQQVDDNILGSFVVIPSAGSEYSGIIFGTLQGDTVWAYYLAKKREGGPDASVALARISIQDGNTLKGSFYYQDTDMIAIPGAPFEAHRVLD